jgi:hypothetical protein
MFLMKWIQLIIIILIFNKKNLLKIYFKLKINLMHKIIPILTKNLSLEPLNSSLLWEVLKVHNTDLINLKLAHPITKIKIIMIILLQIKKWKIHLLIKILKINLYLKKETFLKFINKNSRIFNLIALLLYNNNTDK